MAYSRRIFLKLAAALGFSAASSPLLASQQPGANPIVDENRREGTNQWLLRDRARNREIEGYASRTSVSRGEALSFHIHSIEPRASIEIFRLGWYGGAGGRRMTTPMELSVATQAIPTVDAVTGMIECAWPAVHAVTIPEEWTSGYYVAKLTQAPSGKQAHIPFVVRDARAADHLMVSAVTTWQAYNNWGGRSLYAFNSEGGRQASAVSFDRPYAARGGAGDLFMWEASMLRFLEREGFDVTYATNVDQHAEPAIFDHRKSYLSVGHDEYWSWEMRSNVESAAARGVHLGFFSANTCYWQMRFAPNSRGVADRTVVSYKERALQQDPFALDGDRANDHLVTTLWRNNPVNRPEEDLLGVMYRASPVDGDIVIDDASHWVFDGTGLTRGSSIPGLLGYEVDAVIRGSRPVVRLAHSPFVASDDGERGHSDMTFYERDGRSMVFAAGTIQWSWGLDDLNSPNGVSRVHPAAQQMTRNLLNAFRRGGAGSRRRSGRAR